MPRYAWDSLQADTFLRAGRPVILTDSNFTHTALAAQTDAHPRTTPTEKGAYDIIILCSQPFLIPDVAPLHDRLLYDSVAGAVLSKHNVTAMRARDLRPSAVIRGAVVTALLFPSFPPGATARRRGHESTCVSIGTTARTQNSRQTRGGRGGFRGSGVR